VSRDFQLASDICIILTAFLTFWAYWSFRHEVTSGIDNSVQVLDLLEKIENDAGGIDPPPQTLRRYTHDSVAIALQSVLPSRIAYLAIFFAAASGVLGLVSVCTS
jgi:hypothetical protein